MRKGKKGEGDPKRGQRRWKDEEGWKKKGLKKGEQEEMLNKSGLFFGPFSINETRFFSFYFLLDRFSFLLRLKDVSRWITFPTLNCHEIWETREILFVSTIFVDLWHWTFWFFHSTYFEGQKERMGPDVPQPDIPKEGLVYKVRVSREVLETDSQ